MVRVTQSTACVKHSFRMFQPANGWTYSRFYCHKEAQRFTKKESGERSVLLDLFFVPSRAFLWPFLPIVRPANGRTCSRFYCHKEAQRFTKTNQEQQTRLRPPFFTLNPARLFLQHFWLDSYPIRKRAADGQRIKERPPVPDSFRLGQFS